jgi:hypothetical protein
MQTRLNVGTRVAALVLLAGGAASGTEPPPSMILYPAGNQEGSLPANVAVIAMPY